MKSFVLLIAILFARAGLTQDIMLRTIPDQIRPGMPFVVQANGLFPSPCSLDGGVNSMIETGDNRDTLVLTVLPSELACVQVVTSLSGSFGHFLLDSDYLQSRDSSLRITFANGSEGNVVGSATVEVSADSVEPLPFQSGTYWDQSLSGNAVVLEVQGNTVFLGFLGYRADGDAQWLVELGKIAGGVITGNLNLFGGGSCLPCGDFGVRSTFEGDSIPFVMTLEGSAQAYLSLGSEPGRSLALVPFSPREIVSEGTIAGETFRMPDLTGRWIFVNPDQPEGALVTALSLQFSGISDSGLAFFASSDRAVQMRCSERADSRFSCDLFQDETLVFSATSADISHNAIRTSNIVGRRVD